MGENQAEHLEPPPAGLTSSASGKAANAMEKKAKCGAGFQRTGSPPGQDEVTEAPAFGFRHPQREAYQNFPLPLLVSFAC